MNNNARADDDEAEVCDFKPLTAEEAQHLRERHPELSPWWVIGAQVAAGLIVALVAWVWVRQLAAPVSAIYGAMAVTVPAALFLRAVRRGPEQPSQSAAMLRFFVWEMVKIALTVALLAAAPWLIADLDWLALVVGVVVTLKMYWVALLVRPRLLNRF